MADSGIILEQINARNVCLCGSFRFTEQISKTANHLREAGVDCSTPALERNPASGVRSCFRRIDAADAILIVAPGGYVGTSVLLDIGYAYAKGKPIYITSSHEDKGLMSLVSGVVGEVS
jgi:nucleoside 2-deoxyribosyltransferase